MSCLVKFSVLALLTTLVMFVQDAHCAMTEAQLETAAKLLRKVCQPKMKVTNEQIDAVHRGEFTPEKDIMCYMECVLKTGQIMKDGKVLIDSLRVQLGNLPPSVSEPGLVTTDHCQDSAKSADKCEAAYEFYKCFYTDNPSNFFLP